MSPKLFAWKVSIGKISTKENLKTMGTKINEGFCGSHLETIDHSFKKCSIINLEVNLLNKNEIL